MFQDSEYTSELCDTYSECYTASEDSYFYKSYSLESCCCKWCILCKNNEQQNITDELVIKALDKIERLLHESFCINDKEVLRDILPDYVVRKILCETNELIDCISIKWSKCHKTIRKKYLDTIGKVLLNKLKDIRGSFENYQRWYYNDKRYAQLIIASCLNSCGKVIDKLFRERWNCRVRSLHLLTKQCRPR